jgi:hypothetical protein
MPARERKGWEMQEGEEVGGWQMEAGLGVLDGIKMLDLCVGCNVLDDLCVGWNQDA